jgi:3-dehydro-4-phosphotetronate decarboxylase
MNTGSESRLRDDICAMGKLLYDRGLVHGSTGNISVRLDDGRWLVTPTNACLGRIEPEELALFDTENNQISGTKASKEAFLHRCVYDVRPDTHAVIHTHSTHTVAVSCLERPDDKPVIPPLTAYYVMRVGDLAVVPYYRPGDEALALAVKEMAVKHAAILLANHGPVIAGKSLDQALYGLEELEETAKLSLLLHGRTTRPLTDEQVDELHRVFSS